MCPLLLNIKHIESDELRNKQMKLNIMSSIHH
jgi:hypothetical protein